MAMVGEDLCSELTRQVVAPLVFSIGTRAIPKVLLRRISQILVRYAGSPLSEGKAGKIRGGDRLRWTGLSLNNFEPLRSLNWQVQVYGEPTNDLQRLCRSLELPVHTLDWSTAAKRAGFERNAVYLVRPDSYVALAAGREQGAGKSGDLCKETWAEVQR
jgi:hypothetical protein